MLACSIGVWCVVTPYIECRVDSGEATGGGVVTSGFILAVDLSSLRYFRFLQNNFQNGVSTMNDCVTTVGDYLLVPLDQVLEHVA